MTPSATDIEPMTEKGYLVPSKVRANGRVVAAYTVRESRVVIADLPAASRASAHFLTHPLQLTKRDVDIISGHVVFDYDVSREPSGAPSFGASVSSIATV
ncbi:hypothetical protein [Mycobacterium sp.]|uniref:hypothetical protein n=1 Tax=Mycobacterium sp. TaxID=1785 RepID=UPI003A5BF44B